MSKIKEQLDLWEDGIKRAVAIAPSNTLEKLLFPMPVDNLLALIADAKALEAIKCIIRDDAEPHTDDVVMAKFWRIHAITEETL